MNKFRLLALSVLLVAFSAHADVNGVWGELKLDQDQYLPGEDLQLRFRLHNRSGQEITLGLDNGWLDLEVVNANGTPVPRKGTMPVEGKFSLVTGEVGTRMLNPTPYFDFTAPGRYRLSGTVHLAQWHQNIACKPVSFTVMPGVPLPNLGHLQFGVPPAPGVTNAVPEVREYSLIRVAYGRELTLYMRLTDQYGKVIRVLPLAPMISFSEPEAQIDGDNKLHELHQIGARAFSYSVVDPNGALASHQTFMYSDTRPHLRVSGDGKIFVNGGARRMAATDYPIGEPAVNGVQP